MIVGTAGHIDHGKTALVKALKIKGKATYVVLHANHARELTDAAREACDRFIDAGIPMLSQSVLLKGVNDDPQTLGALLRSNSGVAERLIVEITESMAIHDVDDTRGFVARVKDLGCKIAIDDFGSGYTSFRNLRKLGVDVLKIDGAFVQNLMRSDDDRSFVRSLVDLARRLGLSTVAEWVQDDASAALLTEWGCDYLQGVLIGLASVERPWGDTVKVDRRRTVRE